MSGLRVGNFSPYSSEAPTQAPGASSPGLGASARPRLHAPAATPRPSGPAPSGGGPLDFLHGSMSPQQLPSLTQGPLRHLTEGVANFGGLPGLVGAAGMLTGNNYYENIFGGGQPAAPANRQGLDWQRPRLTDDVPRDLSGYRDVSPQTGYGTPYWDAAPAGPAPQSTPAGPAPGAVPPAGSSSWSTWNWRMPWGQGTSPAPAAVPPAAGPSAAPSAVPRAGSPGSPLAGPPANLSSGINLQPYREQIARQYGVPVGEVTDAQAQALHQQQANPTPILEAVGNQVGAAAVQRAAHQVAPRVVPGFHGANLLTNWLDRTSLPDTLGLRNTWFGNNILGLDPVRAPTRTSIVNNFDDYLRRSHPSNTQNRPGVIENAAQYANTVLRPLDTVSLFTEAINQDAAANQQAQQRDASQRSHVLRARASLMQRLAAGQQLSRGELADLRNWGVPMPVGAVPGRGDTPWHRYRQQYRQAFGAQ